MAKRTQWKANEKARIVIQSLASGNSVSELCNEHGITQGMFYHWKSMLLENASKIFERGGLDRETERLRAENARLKQEIGDLHLQLKKKRMVKKRHRKQTFKYLNLLPTVFDLKAVHPF